MLQKACDAYLDDLNDEVEYFIKETHQFAKDFLFVWSPLYDAKGDQGGLLIYEKSHKHGYYKHHTNNQLGSTNVNDDALKKFKPKKAILTNLSPVLDYKELKRVLPNNTIPAHDGLTLEL